MDYQFYLQNAGLGTVLVAVGLLALSFTVAHLIGKSARVKNRSYRSFFWLSLAFSPLLTALVVATLPFNNYDKRSPVVDMDADKAIPERFLNPYVDEKIAGTPEILFLLLGALLVLVGVGVGIQNINQALQDFYYYN